LYAQTGSAELALLNSGPIAPKLLKALRRREMGAGRRYRVGGSRNRTAGFRFVGARPQEFRAGRVGRIPRWLRTPARQTLSRLRSACCGRDRTGSRIAKKKGTDLGRRATLKGTTTRTREKGKGRSPFPPRAAQRRSSSGKAQRRFAKSVFAASPCGAHYQNYGPARAGGLFDDR